nr:MAG TPA: hypothetical protein [Bacteriophage sp.]
MIKIIYSLILIIIIIRLLFIIKLVIGKMIYIDLV